jgi:hypothetical protein
MQITNPFGQFMIKYRPRAFSIKLMGRFQIDPLRPSLRKKFLKFTSSAFLFYSALLIPYTISKHAIAQESSRSIALLGIKFQNDHDSQEPTTDAERRRLEGLQERFENQINASGKFKIIHIPETIKTKIAEGQFMGECGGCEISYGKALGSDISAWIVVQKVSNLILNINLYMVDINSQKILLVQSVDIRGNTDESWTRGLNYLLTHHVLNNKK